MNPAPLLSERFAETELLRFAGLSTVPGFAHAIATRPWNLSLRRGPQTERALERRRAICTHLRLDPSRLTVPDQIHAPHVLRVRPEDAGRGGDGGPGLPFLDGMVCNLPGVPLLQLSADCPLIVVVDAARRAFGTAHASWRGTVTRIAAQLITVMGREFGSRPEALRAAICPCASGARYEVGDEVRRIADHALPDAARFFPRVGERWHFDLKAANFAELVAGGVPAERIEVAAECSIGDDRFHSHRRDGAAAGRFGLIAGFVA